MYSGHNFGRMERRTGGWRENGQMEQQMGVITCSVLLMGRWELRGSRNAKTSLRVYAGSEGPDQPAHRPCIIRAFAVHIIELLDTIECFNGEQMSE